MTHRNLAWFCALGSALAVMPVAPVVGQTTSPATHPPASSAAPSANQAKASAPAKAWIQPKTPWGDPDIQGLWPATDMINVPMQRPVNQGTRAVLTKEEYAVREQQAQQTAERDKQEYVREGASFGINPPSYWLEHGKPNYQASLLVWIRRTGGLLP